MYKHVICRSLGAFNYILIIKICSVRSCVLIFHSHLKAIIGSLLNEVYFIYIEAFMAFVIAVFIRPIFLFLFIQQSYGLSLEIGDTFYIAIH